MGEKPESMVRSGGAAGRLRGIEGIRAIAAGSIVVYHVFLYAAPDGQKVDLGPATKIFDNLRAGVTLFFVLSGFLLYRVFVGAALRGRPMPSVWGYLRNRALRILPAYWVIFLGVVLVFQHELLTRPLELVANALLVQNYVPAYAVGGEEGLGIVPAWSLVIEVSFYVLLPALGYMAVRRARRTHDVTAVLIPVAAMFAAGLLSKVIARGLESPDALRLWSYSLPTHADWFAAGMAVAVIRVLHEDGRLKVGRAWFAAAAAASALVAVLSTKLYYGGTVSGLEQQTPVAVCFALALAVIVLSRPESPAVRALSWRPLHFLGLASYSLFLLHDPIVRGFREWELTIDGRTGFVVNLAIVGCVSVTLAALTYLYVERPALARKRSWLPGSQAGLGSDAPGAPDASGAPPYEYVTLADALTQSLARASRTGVEIEYTSDLAAQARVRRDVVVPVVVPLVENAVVYGRKFVRVVANASRIGMAVTVEDGGRGVDAAFVPRLFEPNARSERSAAEVPGVGLGLARARALARKNGGDIRYEPRDGGGARFTVFLPAASSEQPDVRSDGETRPMAFDGATGGGSSSATSAQPGVGRRILGTASVPMRAARDVA